MSDELKHLADMGDLRDKLVTTAVKFLTNPDVLRLTNASKEQFLRSKGLTEAEIRAAISKASELINLQAFSTDVMVFQNRRNNWFRETILPFIFYGGMAYGAYWFYKNCVRHLLFVEPKPKTTVECLKELKESIDTLNSNVEALRRDGQTASQQSLGGGVRGQLDSIKSDIASVKGILLNRNQFPPIKSSARSEPPSIPAWQRQSEEASSAAPPLGEEPPESKQRSRSHRSESGGSNSSEGEHVTKNSDKNSDSSLEIIT